jgi:integrase
MVSPQAEQQAEPARRNRRKTLSDKQVANLPRKRKRYFHPDPELAGHGVRVMPEGPHSFYVIARDRFRKQRWVRIGSTTEKTIEGARKIAIEVRERLKAGLEPFEPPKPEPDSVAVVAAEWLARHVRKNGLRTGDEMERILKRHIVPVWGDRPFAEIRRSDIARLLDAIEDKNGSFMADAVLAVLRAISTWFAKRDDSYQPPFVRGMKRVSSDKRKRDRILDDDELRKVWRTAEADTGPFGAFVQLLLLCAQRREKLATMKWDDVASDGTWTIRTEAREKGNPGSLKLPPEAMKIISAQPKFVSSPYVFSSSRGAGKPMHGFSRRHDMFKDRCGVGNWSLHDLRRTARSLMSRARVPGDIAERVLGHARRGIEGTYDRHSYSDEKALALRQLASLIEQIVHPQDNVVPLRQPAEARP